MNARFLVNTILFLFFLFFVQPVSALDDNSTKNLLDSECSTCHKFAGKPESKFNLKGPDLMWAGNKYQRP